MSNSKKRGIFVLSLSVAALATTTATVVYFYFRGLLKYMTIQHKIDDITKKNKYIPFTAKEFKEEWQKQGLTFDSLVFKEYFDYKFNFRNVHRLITTTKLEFLDTKNTEELILKVTLFKSYGKTETKKFVLKDFGFDKKNEKRKIDDMFSGITCVLTDKIKNNAANMLPSEVPSKISSFTIASANEAFHQEDWDWEVETNPNDVTGKLHAKIKMISKRDASIYRELILDNLSPQFKKYEVGKIENAVSQDNIDATSTRDILNYILAKDSSLEVVKEFVKLTYNEKNTVTFIKPLHTINGNKINFWYYISSPRIKSPTNFYDKTSSQVVSYTGNFEVDFTGKFGGPISTKMAEIASQIEFNIANKSKLASEVKASDIETTKPTNIPAEYKIEYYWLSPNDVEGKLIVHAKVTHIQTGRFNNDFSKTVDGFEKDKPNVVAKQDTYDGGTIQSFVAMFNHATTKQEKLLIAKKLFDFKDLEDENIDCQTLVYDNTKQLITLKYKCKKKVINKIDEDGTKHYDDVWFEGEAIKGIH